MYLRQSDIAGIVVDSIRKGVDLGHYELGAYVVMANHVHLLIQPNIAPDRLMKSLKGATAREANQSDRANRGAILPEEVLRPTGEGWVRAKARGLSMV
jgi:REP element-mobilizing transposase RayT